MAEHTDTERIDYEYGQVKGAFEVHAFQIEPQKAAVSFVDITERKRAEEEQARLEARMQHAQKLESLGVMAGGVAHDFNNMLVGMLGHSSVALTKLSPESPAHRNIRSVAGAAQRAADLCRQMLAYSGRGHFLLRPADLNDLVRENLRLLEAAVPKNVRLKAQLSEKPTSIKADLGQMQQLIMNLVLNGSDAIGKEMGSLTVGTGFEVVSDEDGRYSRFTASKVKPGRYVFLEVRDDGCGMDEKTLTSIFDPFFTTKFVGRGLGLAAVLGIVRGHQGGIDIESELGRGTAFRLLLPELENDPKAGSTTTGAMTSGSFEKTVLVIDDEEVVRDALSQMLEASGLPFLMAPDGASGVALCKARAAEIGLVLLDLSMPGMGGEETFRELRRINPDVRVILSSGFSHEEAVQRFFGLGLSGFLQKPYGVDALKAEISRCLAPGNGEC